MVAFTHHGRTQLRTLTRETRTLVLRTFTEEWERRQGSGPRPLTDSLAATTARVAAELRAAGKPDGVVDSASRIVETTVARSKRTWR